MQARSCISLSGIAFIWQRYLFRFLFSYRKDGPVHSRKTAEQPSCSHPSFLNGSQVLERCECLHGFVVRRKFRVRFDVKATLIKISLCLHDDSESIFLVISSGHDAGKHWPCSHESDTPVIRSFGPGDSPKRRGRVYLAG